MTTGCSAEPEPPNVTAVYAAEIEEARIRANDFQLAILEDGVISNAEMLEMQHRFTTCMDEQEFTVWFSDLNGGYSR